MGDRTYKREWITKEQLIQAAVLMRDATSVIDDAISELKANDKIAVGFRPSLDRGLAGMHTFASELRTSLGMMRAGSPFMADEPEPKKRSAKNKSR